MNKRTIAIYPSSVKELAALGQRLKDACLCKKTKPNSARLDLLKSQEYFRKIVYYRIAVRESKLHTAG